MQNQITTLISLGIDKKSIADLTGYLHQPALFIHRDDTTPETRFRLIDASINGKLNLSSDETGFWIH